MQTEDKDKIKISALSNKDFIPIKDGSTMYYGGDQAWYNRYTQSFAGCGPTAAANILVYTAMRHPKLKDLYSYNTQKIHKQDFTSFLKDVYRYVTPMEIPIFNKLSDVQEKQMGIPSLGIFRISEFSRGIEKYAVSRNIKIKSHLPSGKQSLKTTLKHIQEGLKKDCPVAMLNIFNPVDMYWKNPETGSIQKYVYEQHWITITGLIENKTTGEITVEGSSWGGKVSFSLTTLWRNRDWNELIFPGGTVYFTGDI